MATVAIFSSGSGSNFETIAERVLSESNHKIAAMVCNISTAFSFKRAEKLGIESYHIDYRSRKREEVEEELVKYLSSLNVDLIVLAGYMKLLTPVLIDAFSNRIINIHPALLPKYPGTDGIGDSFRSTDRELGITIHRVDYGMDTGPIIRQDSFIRSGEESLEEIAQKIHALEHKNYPEVVLDLLNQI